MPLFNITVYHVILISILIIRQITTFNIILLINKTIIISKQFSHRDHQFTKAYPKIHAMTPNLQNSSLPIHFGLEGANGHNNNCNLVPQTTGGVPIRDSLSQFDRKTKVIVSTPGCLLDIHDKNLLLLTGI